MNRYQQWQQRGRECNREIQGKREARRTRTDRNRNALGVVRKRLRSKRNHGGKTNQSMFVREANTD